MDHNGQGCNKRVCITYIFTFALLVTFFYHMLLNNKQSSSDINHLQKEMDCISQTLLHRLPPQSSDKQPDEKFSCLAGTTAFTGKGAHDLTDLVETMVKRKLGNIMDDVYDLKQQVAGASCKYQGNQPTDSKETSIAVKARINYASEELGARIINVIAKPIGGTNFIQTLLGLDFNANPPVNMLRSSLSPGACFGFSGATATVSLRLAQVIFVEEIILTHVHKEMTPGMCVDNAPKDFAVYGFPPQSRNKELLGQWKYDNAPKKRTQSYIVKSQIPYQSLVFVFSSNHGGNSTCIYRLEVNGRLP